MTNEPPFNSAEQVTAFVDASGRIHVYRGAGIVDVRRLDGAERAAAIDRIRNAIERDYNREVGCG